MMKEKLVPFKNHRFRCLQCGECCRSRSVPLTMEDIKRISKYEDPQEFVTIFNEKKLVLTRREWDYGCIFLRNGDCIIQEEKPLVCQLFPVCVSDNPLLKKNSPVTLVDGGDAYVYVDMSCKGVGHGELLDLEEIKEKGLLLRTQAFATDLEALIGWFIENEKNHR